MGDNQDSYYSRMPLFSCGFLPSGELLTGGGGGDSNSGIPNGLILLKVEKIPKLRVKHLKTHEFASNDDSCYSIGTHPKENKVLCGVNCNEPESGGRKNCRLFELHDSDIFPTKFYETLPKSDEDNYQRLIQFTSDGKTLATLDSLGTVSLWQWPQIKKLKRQPAVDNIVDISFSEDSKHVALISKNTCHIHELEDISSKFLNISFKDIQETRPGNFCFGRFGKHQTKECLFLLFNTSKNSPSARLFKLDYPKKALLVSKKINPFPATSFDISPCGNFIGVAFSNLQIFILRTSNLNVIKKTEVSKSFAITSITFSPVEPILACCTAAGSIFVVDYSVNTSEVARKKYLLILLTSILISLIAVLIKVKGLGLATGSERYDQ